MNEIFNYTKSLHLSLLDFKRVFKLVQETAAIEESVETYIHVNEEGVELPNELQQIDSLIHENGGYQELEYIALAKPESFYVFADFLKRELTIKSKKQEMFDSILRRWERICREVEISRNLISLAVPIEAKRFMFDCLRSDGALTQWPGGPMQLERMYVVPLSEALDLEYFRQRFAEFLAKTQNQDGGWGREAHSESEPFPTAVAILFVSEKSDQSATKKAVEFLLSKRSEDGTWKHLEAPILLNAIVALTLSKTDSELTQELASFVLSELIQSKEGIERDYFSWRALRSLDIDKSHAFDETWEKIDIKSVIEKVSSTNVASKATAINLLLDKGFSRSFIEDYERRTPFRLLIDYRNVDGGWPAKLGQRSELYTTILSSLALKRLYSC